MTSVAATWGSTPGERAMAFPCDAYLLDADTILFRAVDVRAAPSVLYRWLCQLRVAPYSYDWIDNRGRTSPRTLTQGMERLERGQHVMRIFELLDFETDRHLTLALTKPSAVRLFGAIAVSYVVLPSACGSRVVVKLRIRSVSGALGRLRSKLLAWGDLVMMRKQLLTLKQLAERA